MRGPNQARTNRSRSLRKVENDAESVLWSELRSRRLNGHKFTRQLPIGPYFVDFACRDAKLVVEVDGSQHIDSAHDRIRDEFISAEGWSILRIWNVDVLKEIDSVLETILAAIDGRLDRNVKAYDLRFTSADDYEERTS